MTLKAGELQRGEMTELKISNN